MVAESLLGFIMSTLLGYHAGGLGEGICHLEFALKGNEEMISGWSVIDSSFVLITDVISVYKQAVVTRHFPEHLLTRRGASRNRSLILPGPRYFLVRYDASYLPFSIS